MGYEYNDKLKKKACDELEEYGNKSKLTYEDWKAINILEDTVKNINENKIFEESEKEYSEARGGRGRGRSSYESGMSYDDEMMYSGRRGRGTNAKRDSMGRYSSEGDSYEDYSEEMSYRGSQGGRGYSRNDAKDHMMSKLGGMMEDADPNEREILKDCMRKLEKA